jgi:hypothetical protein
MAKVRKILCSLDAPYITCFMRLIETQSKATLGNWGLSYAEECILQIYEKGFADNRPRVALASSRDWFAGKIKLRDMYNECYAAAKEAENNPAAQAAANACANAALLAHTPRHSIGVVLYGVTAIAYDQVGTDEAAETYERLIEDECAKMEAALRAIAVENEPKPVKINWSTFIGEGSLFRRRSQVPYSE